MAGGVDKVFESIYATGAWGGGSGAGSWPHHTIRYRAFLQEFMAMNQVRSVVDIGCGDWQFSNLVDWSGIEYLGLDVVPSVITANVTRHAATNVRFDLMPDDLTEVPRADLLIIKDVLMHLPVAAIERFIGIFPRYRHSLISNDTWWQSQAHQLNADIEPGNIRPLDLRVPPFSVTGAYVFEHTKQGGDCKTFRTLLVT